MYRGLPVSATLFVVITLGWKGLVVSSPAKPGKQWLDYACSTIGDLSVVNPKPAIYRGAVAKTVDGPCNVTAEANYTYFTITACPNATTWPLVTVTLSEQEDLSPYIGGGKNTEMYKATCNLHPGPWEIGYKMLVNVTMHATVLYRSLQGFDPEDEDPGVTVVIRELQGMEGYTVFTMGYPIIVELVGTGQGMVGYTVFTMGYPIIVELVGTANTEMMVEKCVGYAGAHSHAANPDYGHLNKRIIQDGCSTDNGLMFNFTSTPISWWSRNVTEFDPDLIFHAEMEGEEPATTTTPPPPPPSLWTHVFAFRFLSFMELTIHCDVRVCPSGSGDCHSPCDPTTQSISTTPPVETEQEEEDGEE